MTGSLLAALIATSAIAPTPKLVSIVWDGASDWAIDRLLAEGRLPNLAKMKREGAWAESVSPAWPSKTAVGHASLFTGVWPDQNGIGNNAVPLHPAHEHTCLESMRGFDATALTAEPIWVTAANAGKNVVAFSAACSYPPSAFEKSLRPGAKFKEFSGFESEFSGRQMITNSEKKTQFSVSVGDSSFEVKLLDLDRKLGFDRVQIHPAGGALSTQSTLVPEESTNKIGKWLGPFRVKKGADEGLVYFRLFSLDDDGEMELYVRAAAAIKGTESASGNMDYLQAYGGFHDDAWSLYGRGGLGKTLWQGGTGVAEERILEIVRLDCEFLKRSFRYGWTRWKPDLSFHYTPMSDSAGHMLYGAFFPGGKPVTGNIADKLWDVYARVLELQDDWLGDILKTVQGEAIVSVTGDHGMEGNHSTLFLNKALADAGLLAWDDKGQIDLSKTKIMVPPWSDFFLVVNSTDRKNGIVKPEDKEAVVELARQALGGLKDPRTGQAVVVGLMDPTTHVGFGIGGKNGGDLYVEPAPGYYPSNRKSDSLVADLGPIGAGNHGFLPMRRSMQTVLYAMGPGLPRKNLGAIRQIDVMPFLAEKIGVTFPRR